jgi:flagellar biosynthesis protein FlhF
MKIKRYVAPSAREALALIKTDFGDDAVILSNKNVTEGVEVMVAIDPDIEDFASPPAKDPQSAQPEFEPVVYSRPSQLSPELEKSIKHEAVESSSVATEELNRMAQELQSLREIIENQMSSMAWGQKSILKPEQANLTKKLLKLGFAWDFADKTINYLSQTNKLDWTQILNFIQRSYAFVGPTGVGKTTTIAKIASRFVMRHSPRELALITTDTFKVGAQEQLKTFADLIEVPIYTAKSRSELDRLLESMQSKKLILIDTSGTSQRDLQLSNQLTASTLGQQVINNYLVISAGSQLGVLENIVEQFRQLTLEGVILTKVDEAMQLGSAFNVLIEQKLPLQYVSIGQKVPEDLEKARANDLIDRLVVLGQLLGREVPASALKSGMGKEAFSG